MAFTALSKGAVIKLTNGDKPDSPIFQCIAIKKLQSDGKLRHRLLLSDGDHSFGTTMLATQLNPLVAEDKLNQFSIVKMSKYQCTKVHGDKLVVICIGIDILHCGKEVGSKIGDPIPVGTQSTQPSAPKKPTPNPVTNNHKPPVNNMESPKPTGKMPFSSGSAPTTPGGSATKVVPIQGLTPYQNRWTIRARVTNKGGIKEWKNNRGEGKLFNFTVCDQSGDIRITCFNEEATKFFDVIEPNKVFLVSNATLKPANAQYNNTSHDYEMTLRRDSVVSLCQEAESDLVPKLNYDFVPIKNLSEKVGKFVDVIGIVKEIDELQTVMIRSQNRETSVRKFFLVDQSNAQIRCTLWGKEAEDFEGSGNPVISFRGARISDYGGCSLSTTGGTTMTVNPDVSEAHTLKQWFAAGGGSQNVESLSSEAARGSAANWKTLSEIKEENLGYGEKPDYVTSKVTILYCKKENSLYQACPKEDCNKKVIDLSNGQYRCEKCNTTTDNFKYRMIMNVHVADEYDSQWVTIFPEQGELLVGMTSQELGELKDNDENAFEMALRKIYFTSYFMKFRVKAERFNDEQRIRVSAVNLSPISYSEYNKKLKDDLQRLVQE